MATRPIAAATATSAPTPPPRGRSLYLCEDVILGRVFAELHILTSRDAGIAAQIARLQDNQNGADVIKFLRAYHVVIECRAASVTREPDHEKSIIVWTPVDGPERKEAIPRQRTRREKQQRDIAER